MNKKRCEYLNDRLKNLYKRYTIIVNNEEKDVIKQLESTKNKSGYVVELIKKDIK